MMGCPLWSELRDDVARLMAGDRAGLMATDPPYLVDYDGTNHLPPNTDDVRVPEDRPWDAYIDAGHASAFFTGFLAVALAEALTECAPMAEAQVTIDTAEARTCFGPSTSASSRYLTSAGAQPVSHSLS